MEELSVIAKIKMAMAELKVALADALDDDYSDIQNDILSQYDMTDEENNFCLDNYLNMA